MEFPHWEGKKRQKIAEETGTGSWSSEDEETRYCNGSWKALGRNQKEAHNSLCINHLSHSNHKAQII